jgi:hypothetical protein
MQVGRRLYFRGQYAACKHGEDLPNPLSGHLQEFAISIWHPSIFEKIRKKRTPTVWQTNLAKIATCHISPPHA